MDAKRPRPWWWRRLWIGTLLSILALGVVSFFLWHVSVWRVMSGVALSLLVVGFAYFIRIRPSRKVNRTIYITFGASGTYLIVLFGGAFIIKATGVPPPNSHFGFIIFLIAPWIIGAFIGDWIGKQRNYRLPLSLENP